MIIVSIWSIRTFNIMCNLHMIKCRGHNLTYVLFLLKKHNLNFNFQKTSDKIKSRGHCGSAGKTNCLQCGRLGFNPWAGKIRWGRKRLPAPVFWPGEFWVAESDKTEWCSLSAKYLTWFFFKCQWNEKQSKIEKLNSD